LLGGKAIFVYRKGNEMFLVMLETTKGSFEMKVPGITKAWALLDAQMRIPEGSIITDSLVIKL